MIAMELTPIDIPECSEPSGVPGRAEAGTHWEVRGPLSLFKMIQLALLSKHPCGISKFPARSEDGDGDTPSSSTTTEAGNVP